MPSQSIPVPRPPRKRKRNIFDPEQYKHIDDHVEKVPSSLLRRPLRLLVTHLVSDIEGDLGRVRALFHWLVSIDMTSLERPSTNHSVDSAINHLLRVKERASNHASLFMALCKEADIPCVKIMGVSKNSRYKIGQSVNMAHVRSQWNAVVVDGEWRPLDALWASTVIVGRHLESSEQSGNDDDDDDGGEDANADDTAVAHKRDDFYFLTDPDEMIYTHFPDDSKWQLLNQRVTLKEFEQMPYLRERFFQMGVTFSEESHRRCLIETTDGEVYFQFNLDPGRDPGLQESCAFEYLLRRQKNKKKPSSKGKTAEEKSDSLRTGKPLQKAVSLTQYPEELRVLVNLPDTGRYELLIYGRDKRHFKKFDLMCIYLLDYCQPDEANFDVRFFFNAPSEHARYMRRGSAFDWLKRKDASLKVSGHEIVLSFSLSARTLSDKQFLCGFEGHHQIVPPVIRSLLQVIPREFKIDEAYDVDSGRTEWKVGPMRIRFLSHVNGLVRTPDGQASIKLVKNAETELWYQLNEDTPLRNVHRDAVQFVPGSEGEDDEKTLSMKIRLTNPMDYHLHLFGRNKTRLNTFYHVKTYSVQYELLDFV